MSEIANAYTINLGEVLPLWSMTPFAGMLLSIAVFPVLAPRFWHDHFGKISAFWSLLMVLPFLVVFKRAALHEVLHILLADYIPFIILLGALYTVLGGILLRGTMRGTPLVNTCMLAIGTLLASWMGTTGAAMLMIRPFLRANAHRKHRAFMVVFFIFLVANIGGSLTPLGDPPLFLGFLRGVPFFWTFSLLPHMAVAAALLLAVYAVMDIFFYKKEGSAVLAGDKVKEPLRIEGGCNFLFLLGIIGAVLLSGIARWGEVSLLGIHRNVQDIVRDMLVLLLGLLSFSTTPRRVREENDFTWFPIKEVAILFAGIFLTMIPCLKILQVGPKGALAVLLESVREPSHYFWVTGILSSFLDNAPTYLTFLNTATGSFYPGIPESRAVAVLVKEHPVFLMAVSAGAVFFGAATYIGNAPNFMVRSIAEESGVPMPSFFGYMIKYSVLFLVPIFLVITVIFF